ncbi:hypothetical protein ZYGR_0I02430 [Zygosaccharomyces rouxii]|uniref:ZYRO0C05764p n=2 Tax=Zygosaccharomyces rouxii TaxID=4956 RepID=C5DT62_ZYGRC|nr:uncharacterized protein ZYRO0C05764g [Zygosaccharomyces rouxii]GAV47947.1 hypothetical protein ZYGR_0I02430 [Zygosaccharomyces rouxii]CAR26973.1 ZYRO0C05764p [Zygosaccharomyces rouxii]
MGLDGKVLATLLDRCVFSGNPFSSRESGPWGIHHHAGSVWVSQLQRERSNWLVVEVGMKLSLARSLCTLFSI